MTVAVPTNDLDRAVDFVEAHKTSNKFLASLSAYYRVHHTLTPAQIKAVKKIQQDKRGR